jgi:uncharacterized membrane protein
MTRRHPKTVIVYLVACFLNVAPCLIAVGCSRNSSVEAAVEAQRIANASKAASANANTAVDVSTDVALNATTGVEAGKEKEQKLRE